MAPDPISGRTNTAEENRRRWTLRDWTQQGEERTRDAAVFRDDRIVCHLSDGASLCFLADASIDFPKSDADYSGRAG